MERNPSLQTARELGRLLFLRFLIDKGKVKLERGPIWHNDRTS